MHEWDECLEITKSQSIDCVTSFPGKKNKKWSFIQIIAFARLETLKVYCTIYAVTRRYRRVITNRVSTEFRRHGIPDSFQEYFSWLMKQ